MDATNSSRTQPLYRATQVVWYLLGVLEVLLGLRFVLKFLAANPSAGFSSFIYGITAPFAAPFLSVFRISRVEGTVVEWTTLLAMLVYWIVAYGIIRLLLISKPVSTPEAAVKLERQEK
jgi:hypothetical protein